MFKSTMPEYSNGTRRSLAHYALRFLIGPVAELLKMEDKQVGGERNHVHAAALSFAGVGCYFSTVS